MAGLFGSSPPSRNIGISDEEITASMNGLADFTSGIARIWRTTRSSRLLMLISATSRCITVMLPAAAAAGEAVELADHALHQTAQHDERADADADAGSRQQRAIAAPPQVAKALVADPPKPAGRRRRPPPS